VYSYYNVPGKHTLEQLLADALILAHKVCACQSLLVAA
jgi:hypothetical protein